MEGYEFSVLGFTRDSKFIYFRVDNEIIKLKSTLKKEELIAHLDIMPSEVKSLKEKNIA